MPTLLNRQGNKNLIAHKIQEYFPPHDLYIEPFFGAGGMFFNKPKAKWNFLNDKDNEVYNLFRVILDSKEEFKELIRLTPITETQIREWGIGKRREKTPMLNALRFLIHSNYVIFGSSTYTLRLSPTNPKNNILSEFDKVFEYLSDAYFFNCDFREVFRKVDYKTNKESTFCYCDPPYVDTYDNYSHSFTKRDSYDLFNILQASGIKWAMSEFENDFILMEAKQRGLNVYEVGERRNLANERTEILITNYKQQKSEFQLF